MVRATLPSYIDWTGVKNPTSENITYNKDTHEVIWNAGSVASGTGLGSSSKEAAFQISFLPSTSQLGTVPELVGQAKITGIDKVTGTQVDYTIASMTTNFSSDPSYHDGDDRVQ
jgi:hypothetical protein